MDFNNFLKVGLLSIILSIIVSYALRFYLITKLNISINDGVIYGSFKVGIYDIISCIAIMSISIM